MDMRHSLYQTGTEIRFHSLFGESYVLIQILPAHLDDLSKFLAIFRHQFVHLYSGNSSPLLLM
jgi:hypothetical protein